MSEDPKGRSVTRVATEQRSHKQVLRVYPAQAGPGGEKTVIVEYLLELLTLITCLQVLCSSSLTESRPSATRSCWDSAILLHVNELADKLPACRGFWQVIKCQPQHLLSRILQRARAYNTPLWILCTDRVHTECLS